MGADAAIVGLLLHPVRRSYRGVGRDEGPINVVARSATPSCLPDPEQVICPEGYF